MIYLASTSPRRKKLLKEAGIRFRALTPRYAEEKALSSPPEKIVKTHALGKALSVAHRVKDGTILSADTLVCCRGQVLGKPKNLREAARILQGLAGRWHTVYTGVAILRVKKRTVRKKRVFLRKTRIRIRPMSRAAILAYFKKVNPLDKAGAYAIQSPRARIVTGMRGSLTNAVGLPMESLGRL